MNPRFHPREDHWLDYAAGQLDGPTRCLLEAHLAFCESCLRQAAGFNAPGGDLLAGLPDAPVPSGLLGGILDRLKAPEPPRVGTETLPIPGTSGTCCRPSRAFPGGGP